MLVFFINEVFKNGIESHAAVLWRNEWLSYPNLNHKAFVYVYKIDKSIVTFNVYGTSFRFGDSVPTHHTALFKTQRKDDRFSFFLGIVLTYTYISIAHRKPEYVW